MLGLVKNTIQKACEEVNIISDCCHLIKGLRKGKDRNLTGMEKKTIPERPSSQSP